MMIIDLNTNAQEPDDTNNTSPSNCNEPKKSCIDCQTTRTPCWRVGPAGPKTLCNACGIRYRKKRRALLGMDKGRTERSRKKIAKSSRSKLGEVEQAAILLMALSYGCVSA